MASSEETSLGDQLIKMGKMLNISKVIAEISKDTKCLLENLESIKKETACASVAGVSSVDRFRGILNTCIATAESLVRQIDTVIQEHSICLQAFKSMADSGTMTPELVADMTRSLRRVIDQCEGLEANTRAFFSNVQELQTDAERAYKEVLCEEQKVRSDTSSTRSEAQRNSVRAWAARIFTFGLITWSKSFQKSVKENAERHQVADELGDLAQKFRRLRESLDLAMKQAQLIAERVSSGPIKMSEELVEIIRDVLTTYMTVTSQAATIRQQAEEIERLKRQVEKLQADKNKS